LKPTTPAEHALLTGFQCDLRTASERREPGWKPTEAIATRWGDERTIRAEFLRHLLVDQHRPVHLTGARIDGKLDAADETVTLSLPACVLTGSATFDRATFTGFAGFDGAVFPVSAHFGSATFTGSARFGRATFTGIAEFEGANFTKAVEFGQAMFTSAARFGEATFTGTTGFGRATFTGTAWFERANFTGTAGFERATFSRDSCFRRATFASTARFGEAMFTGTVSFSETRFDGTAGFDSATFTGTAGFERATFTGTAGFERATFTRPAGFDSATFTNAVQFGMARFRQLGWSGTRWEAEKVSTMGLAADEISLDDAAFECPIRLDLMAKSITMHRARANARLHLRVAAAAVDCEDADLADGSLIESAPVAIPPDDRWVEVASTVADTLVRGALNTADELNTALTEALHAHARASITSLQRAHVAGTTLSGMDLQDCTFASVDGLDQLIITGDNILKSNRHLRARHWAGGGEGTGKVTPQWWRAQRRVIKDELVARGIASPSAPPTPGDTDSTPVASATPVESPSAREVSATYRSLRKALEDNKDEPGAADFYYGEMEMRRRAADRWSVERWLLTAYWLVSGYGLRAWRALTALLVVIGVAGWCFTNDAWAHKATTTSPTEVNLQTGKIISEPPAEEGLSILRAWLFAAQETVALIRPGAPGVTLTGVGHVVDLIVRILGPVLLALAVLAIRNRTKR
jgi:uncharacterized protein YjbI with pentapeptide repeats